MQKKKYKGFSIVSISTRDRMYEKGYRYRATGHGSKVYAMTLKKIKEMVDNIVKKRREFERKYDIRSELRW